MISLRSLLLVWQDPTPMRSVWLSVICVAVLGLTGCKTSCRQLSEKQCDCTNSTTERTSCLQVAATKEANGLVVTEADEARCEALLEVCDCRLIDTPAGKMRCGLAEQGDGGF